MDFALRFFEKALFPGSAGTTDLTVQAVLPTGEPWSEGEGATVTRPLGRLTSNLTGTRFATMTRSRQASR